MTGIELHAADSIKLPAFSLAVGAVTDTVTVETASQILTTANGERTELLSYQDIQDIALEGRDTTELLKVLPGVVTMTSNNVPTASFLDVTSGQSAIGQGLNTNGAPNRGGTTIMIDGVSVLDPGADFSSLVTLNPEMTQEVNVLATNFDAATPFGPVVISSISRSGGSQVSRRSVLRRSQRRAERQRLAGQSHRPREGRRTLLLSGWQHQRCDTPHPEESFSSSAASSSSIRIKATKIL